MKQDKRTWKLICLMTALSVFFVVMTEARPSRFSRPPIKRDNMHVLTERKRIPDLAFFWNINQKISHTPHHLSNEQQTQLKEAFWKMYAQTVAVQEEASENASRGLEEAARPTQMGYVLANYINTLDGILTSEQHDHHRKHLPRVTSPDLFPVVAHVRAYPSPSGTLSENDIRSHAYAEEDTRDVTQRSAWTTLVQVDSQAPFSQHLSQLQTLRL